jgi:uncharacterized protein (TIGR03435 family)
MLAPENRAQSQAIARLEFDVASIKPNHATGGATFGAGAGRAGGRNVTLKTLIALAYRIQEFQITGGPSWVGSDHFDVDGRADPKFDPDQMRLMLQSLMADRFQLKFHRETKQSSVYALVVGKGGPKIRLVADQQSPDVNGPSQPGAGPNRGAFRFGGGSLIGNAVTLPLFVRFLSQRLDGAIIDKTNLTGRFNIQLQWTPSAGEMPYDPGGNILPPADSSGPSVFVAIQEQLGLRLESTKGPVELFVIDRVEKPSEN